MGCRFCNVCRKVFKIQCEREVVRLLQTCNPHGEQNPAISMNGCDSHFVIHREMFKNTCKTYAEVVFACYIENPVQRVAVLFIL